MNPSPIQVAYISVVVPVFNCSQALPELCERLHAAVGLITPDYEIILVNDASTDEGWIAIQALAITDSRVKGINLSRNFGQHYAIAAGLDFALGDWVVVMDGDLQDLPEEIPKLYQTAQSNYDMVVGFRADRKDHWFKKTLSKSFHRVFHYLSGISVNNSIGNFGIYSKRVIRNIQALKETTRSFGLLTLWVGFRRSEVEVRHAARPYGRSSYTFSKMVELALNSIVAHCDKLLRLTIKLGLLVSLISLVCSAWIVLSYFVWATPIMGWTSLIVSIFLMSGLVLGTIGIVGLYIGRILEEVRGRPLYIIDTTTFETSRYDH